MLYNNAMENINEEKLQELGIFEIRNIARDVGVYSPTLFKKQELIDKIMRVITGKDEPYVKKTKQGRPPKNISNLNNLVDVIMPTKLFEDKKESDYSYFNDINENINVASCDGKEKIFKGYVKVYVDDFALVFYENFKEDKNVVFVTSQQIKQYKLKSGDIITGKAIFVDDSKPFILKEVYSINEMQFNSSFERNEDFENKFAIYATKKLKINVYKGEDEIFNLIDSKSPFAKGQRVLLKNANNFSFEILHKLTTGNNNLKGLAILIDESPENYFEVNSNSKLSVISNNFGNRVNNLALEIEVKLDNLLRQVELGEDVILFINSLEKYINYFVNENILNKLTKEEAIAKTKKNLNDIILLGKNTNNGSLTVVVNAENSNEFDSLFNNILVFDKLKYKVILNEELSYTLNLEKIK